MELRLLQLMGENVGTGYPLAGAAMSALLTYRAGQALNSMPLGGSPAHGILPVPYLRLSKALFRPVLGLNVSAKAVANT